MRNALQNLPLLLFGFSVSALVSCQQKDKAPDSALIQSMNLKRGEALACGPADKEFGTVGFETSCSGNIKADFDLGIALLHSFEYDEAEKAFAKVIDTAPDCAMAYWGVAMSNYHPLWSAPTQPELEKGAKAIGIAQSISDKSKKESAYIDAVALFYKDWNTTDHRTRGGNFAKAMEGIYQKYPEDKEAAVFYALALTATADPTDKTFKNQKKAGDILNALYPDQPNHPGVVHYIIHAYDSPELAHLGLDAARKYASVAPSSAHALHMPSHIFTRLGLWEECNSSNRASVSSAQCYAENNGFKHWDEELHGLDYLMYGYLQQGDNSEAETQLKYFKSIWDVQPVNFKVAYAWAAIPARYYVENKMWKEAATLQDHDTLVKWKQYPWQRAITHFTRILGAVHTNELIGAKIDYIALNTLHAELIAAKDKYRANQVEIQIKSAEAWMQFKEGKKEEALKVMYAAADMEDKTEKSPVTPGEIVPARELLADMLLEMNKPAEALQAYEADLKKQPNRFNGVYGAAVAAEKSGDSKKAAQYYQLLTEIASKESTRPEIKRAKAFLQLHPLASSQTLRKNYKSTSLARL